MNGTMEAQGVSAPEPAAEEHLSAKSAPTVTQAMNVTFDFFEDAADANRDCGGDGVDDLLDWYSDEELAALMANIISTMIAVEEMSHFVARYAMMTRGLMVTGGDLLDSVTGEKIASTDPIDAIGV